ncbi:MAG: 2-oxoacid:ferredoxin oxidoreductase subunit alpha [Ignisphaera sp.]
MLRVEQMPREGLSMILGGPQGAGVETSMTVLARALARRGYGVIADREYFSNITGRHSYIHMYVSAKSLPRSLRYPVDILAAMDAETVFTHIDDLGERGYVIYDTGVLQKKLDEIPSMEDVTKNRVREELRRLGVEPVVEDVLNFLRDSKGAGIIGISFADVLKTLMTKHKVDPRRASRYVSGIIVSAVAVLLGLDEESIRWSFSIQFAGREDLVAQNMDVLKFVEERMRSFRGVASLEKPSNSYSKLMVATGNDVVAMGKIVGGLRYQSYYPITPAADESFTIEKYEFSEVDGVSVGPIIVMQTEDEIAAICSAIGAALTGARSATATSGPGFDLMVEGLSWAGANEVPVVITYYQRGGPSTGQPTRGSQSDLFNALFAGHGEFARVVIASGDHEEAFYDAIEAFNIAERFQVPVIHLLDKFLANTVKTVPLPDLNKVKIFRGDISSGGLNYKRFDLSKLISPRAFLGTPDTVMWYAGDEHDELGHIVEDPENRVSMYSKRIEKMDLILRELPPERKFSLHGIDKPDFLVVGWGSVKGVALDALETLEKDGLKGAYLNLKLLWPFPLDDVSKILSSVSLDRVIAVEHSYGVQIARLISMGTGMRIRKTVAKFTGRPITLDELVDALKRILLNNVDRVVLKHGA